MRPILESAPRRAARPAGEPLLARHFVHNNCVFLDGDYLIKGVAGAVFRRLVEDWLASGPRSSTTASCAWTRA